VRTDSLVRDTLWMPTGFDVAGCFQGEPIRRRTSTFGPDRYTLTYFDPYARRYKQKTYEAGRPDWALWPEVEIRTNPTGLTGHASLGLRWRKLTVTAGYATTPAGRGLTASLRLRPFTITP